MRIKIKVVYGMRGLSMCGMQDKIFQWEQDLLTLTGQVWDSFKIDGWVWDENRKITLTCNRGYVEYCNSNQTGSR